MTNELSSEIDKGLLLGLDVGGTFTDAAVVDEDGHIYVGKALTTKSNYLDGILEAIGAASNGSGQGVNGTLAATATLKHGTTVGTNAIIQRSGAKVGLLTTRGFEDTMIIMRAHGRHIDLTPEELIDFKTTDKPEPLVPLRLIAGINERIDFRGDEVVALDEAGLRASIADLLEQEVEAIAICFLWSFINDAHERRAAEIVREIAPDLFVSLSSVVAPKLGEYERSAAAVVNAYLGPMMSSYLTRFRNAIGENGHVGEPLIVQCAGGVISVRKAAAEPLATIDSGPAAGLVGSAFLAGEMGISNVVTTDMGGTSFDVGLITDGAPVKRELTVIDKYECFIPRIDVRAIGSGGGSIVWVDDAGRLNVGPQSAGSDPGPAFFGRGGEQPTVADANLLLRFLDPAFFFGGKISVDRGAAERAMLKIAGRLGLDDPVEVAAGVVTIVEHKMADLIRKVTIEQGYDVRDFVTFAYGGSSAIHAAAYARALGIGKVVVPLGRASSVFSALGAAVANVLQVFDKPLFMDSPLDVSVIADGFDELEREARARLQDEGLRPEVIQIDRFALMRHKAQVYELPIPVGELRGTDPEALVQTFEQRYENLYGEGSAFSAGGITVATLRVEARGIVFNGKLAADELSEDISEAAQLPDREIHWPDLGRAQTTRIYHGPDLRPGNQLEGPAVIQSAETTVVVPTGDVLSVDRFGSYVIDLAVSGDN